MDLNGNTKIKSIKYPASLHNHTMYSNLRLRDSINRTEELIKYAIELGHNGIAITEHETIANAIEIEECWERIKKDNPNFKIIRGNEIYLVRNGLTGQNFNKENDSYTHFLLLALDAEGHKQIREISTRAWKRSYISRGLRRVPTYYQDLVEVIGENTGHLVASTACIGGALGTQLLRYKNNPSDAHLEKIKNWCLQMEKVFGKDNFYLEMQPSDGWEQRYVNQWIVKLSSELNIPCIITNDAHYLKKEDLKIQKIFLNSQGGDREVESFYATTYLMSDEEILSFMEEQIGTEEIQKAYHNIQNILDRAQDYTLKKPLKIPSLPWREIYSYKSEYDFWFAKIPTLKEFYKSEFKSDNYLVDAVIEGIKNHLDLQNQEAYREIDLCLQDTWESSKVNNAQWSAYFLNLQKVIDVCWEAGTVVGCGRGSGVGFILLYCLDITQINPLREQTKTFRFRFLNPERVSVLDIDTDITGLNRNAILDYIRNYYGQDRVANVLTLRTEKSKSAILAAARGLGIDVDIAQYISNLIPSERGQIWPLKDCMYGNETEGRKPVKQFVFEMTENYPEIWEVVQKTENLIVGMGEHAGGLILVDEPFTESTALMRAPNGDIMTQFELHTAEKASLIKLDLLSIEAVDKIQICLHLLQQYGFIDKNLSLREAYESVLGIYSIEREAPEMWKMVHNHKIPSLFQLTQQSGINGIKALKPTSVDDLSVLNSAIRLMAQEQGGEMPVDKLTRFKKNNSDWDKEIAEHGLDIDNTKKLLDPVLNTSYGLCITQEQFMQLVQMPELGGMSLTQSDVLRKSIAKKNPEGYEKWMQEYKKTCSEKGLDMKLINYVIELIEMSRGYGFNASHTLAYSLIALQEMNLAFKYPIIFWNCACLIADSGGAEIEKEEEDEENYVEEVYSSDFEEFYEETEDEDEDEEGGAAEKDKKKKKVQNTDYGKIATAIGKMREQGILVSPPDINKSTLTFSPDVENSTIRYGLNGISKVKKELAQEIIDNRPYTGIEDFLKKIKIDKPKMINLIKSGAFDKFGDRVEIMKQYIRLVADLKKRVTLQNMKMLCDFGLIPDEYDMQRKVFFFNKYLKKMKIGTTHYGLDNTAMRFYEQHFDMDLLDLTNTESGFAIPQTKWDNIYQHHMDIVRPFVKNNNQELLEAMNNKIIGQFWDKYCQGTLSKWEMDAVSFYSHPHELAQVNNHGYGFSNFNDLREEPEIDSIIFIKDKQTKEMKRIPLFKITRIAGTVLDKNKDKKTVTLLTTDGVVTVKIYGNVYANYDKQISVKGADGKKHIVEKSWLQRGNKIIVTGIRRGDEFLAKKYSRTPYHLVELITEVGEDGFLVTKGEREAV